MTDTPTTTISVRGDAQRTVAPDQAQLMTTVNHTSGSKADAMAAVQRPAGEVIQVLADLGGRALTVDSLRAPLTWSVPSVRTNEEYADKGSLPGPTGRHICSLTLLVTVRDFGLLARITEELGRHDDIRLHSVSWTVDDDNPEWAHVRADAIHAALRKGDDYAVALGGSVIAVQHVADAGLLNGQESGGWVPHRAVGLAMGAAGGGSGDLTLDPVPQIVSAVIDARFTATIGALPGR